MHRLDRGSDVVGAEPPGEHDPAVGRLGAGEMVGVVLFPREIEDAGDGLALAQQDGVPAA